MALLFEGVQKHYQKLQQYVNTSREKYIGFTAKDMKV